MSLQSAISGHFTSSYYGCDIAPWGTVKSVAASRFEDSPSLNCTVFSLRFLALVRILLYLGRKVVNQFLALFMLAFN